MIRDSMQRPALAAMRRRLLFWAVALLTLACSGALTDVAPVAGTVASIAITPPSATVVLGQQLPLQAVATDAAGKVVASPAILWTIRDTAIASVSASGIVSARAIGTTQVAASASGHSAVATIAVGIPAVASVALAPSHVDAVVGATAQFTAVALDASQRPLAGRSITWTSSDESVAPVDSTGNMTARGAGTATITAASEGKSASATVTVTQAPVATVSITPNPLSMSVGQSTPLTAIALDAGGNVVTGRPIAWTTSNQSIAGVSATGVVTAIVAGSVVITATVDAKTATANVTVSNFAVGSVSVQPQGATVVEHSSTQLSAVVRDVTGALTTGRVVTWSSSSNGVATVSGTGLVTGVKTGTVTITATSEGKSGATTVTVTPAPASHVVLTSPATSVTVGQSLTITSAVLDADSLPLIGRTLTWSSSNTSIASVTNAGVVNAVAPGAVVISATTTDGKTGSAPLTVVPIPVASVAVAPSSANLTVGQSVTLSATAKDVGGNALSGRSIAWSTSDATIASVSSAGVVSGVGSGSATITATSEGQSGSATVTITPAPVGSVSLPATTSLIAGQAVTLSPTIKDVNGTVVTNRVVTWSSDHSAVATVSSAGLVTGVAPGTATVTATSEGKSGSTVVTVTAAPVASVAIAPSAVSLVAGQTTTLVATPKDAGGNALNGRSVTWNSSVPTVATVSQTGVVTAIAPGAATITATSEGKSATAGVTVTAVPAASVTVTPAATTLIQGATAPLSATVKDAAGNVLVGRAISWSTSAPGVATVSATGVVTAIAAGNATITATSGSASGTANVTVTVAPVATVSVNPATATLIAGTTTTLTTTLKDASGNVLTGRTVTWSTNAPGVATVSPAGVVTAVGAGSATITATSGSASGTASITVTPAPVKTVTISPAAPKVRVGAHTTLSATLKDSGGNVLTGRVVTWTSSARSIATVQSDGTVTGIAKGNAVITATSEGKSGTVTVVVSP